MLLVTASESKQDQHVDEEEFDDVDDHATERNLQRSQVRTDTEYVDSLQIAAIFIKSINSYAIDILINGSSDRMRTFLCNE